MDRWLDGRKPLRRPRAVWPGAIAPALRCACSTPDPPPADAGLVLRGWRRPLWHCPARAENRRAFPCPPRTAPPLSCGSGRLPCPADDRDAVSAPCQSCNASALFLRCGRCGPPADARTPCGLDRLLCQLVSPRGSTRLTCHDPCRRISASPYPLSGLIEEKQVFCPEAGFEPLARGQFPSVVHKGRQQPCGPGGAGVDQRIRTEMLNDLDRHFQ